MEPGRVRELEEEIGEAIAKVLRRKTSPLPDPRTIHLMAKAAVTVLEAVTEKTDGGAG
jgi:hypothetical protein